MNNREEVQQRIAMIVNDREHGSRWLVREAITLIRDMAREQHGEQEERLREIFHVARVLAQARPAMAALSSAMSQVLFEQRDAAAIAQRAMQLLGEYDAAIQHIIQHGKPFLYGQLMTCSISGTVVEALIACKEQITGVVVLEGRPRYEGRETARLLRQAGIEVTLITDAQADIFLPGCQGVVVGADTVLATGDVLNKAGTALLGWASQGHGVPLYVLCETLKISPRRWSGEAAHRGDNLTLLEEKEPGEVLETPIPGVRVRNFYFDHTPHMLVKHWISERGVLELHAINEIAARVALQEEYLTHTPA